MEDSKVTSKEYLKGMLHEREVWQFFLQAGLQSAALAICLTTDRPCGDVHAELLARFVPQGDNSADDWGVLYGAVVGKRVKLEYELEELKKEIEHLRKELELYKKGTRDGEQQ